MDGWDAENRTAYQFHGCYFHGHGCYKTKGETHNKLNGKSFRELREKTGEISKYLKEEVGVKVVEMWECRWDHMRCHDPEVRQFCRSRFPYKRADFSHCEAITPDDILRSVKEEKLFGLIECDIEVPDTLKNHFSELQPIFKNTEVSREDMGDFMKKYAEKHKIMSQPRRTLIASYFGKRILLATPLLLWYLDHGLVVTDIHLVIEYEPKACFRVFGEAVSQARREGDKDSEKAILANTFKLLGNSAYGKTLTNKEKFRNVSYITPDLVGLKVNSPLFRAMHELSEDLAEVESAQKTIRWDLPNQIGLFVYQYAKLRMLQFHYECLDKYVSREDYQLCEMDTDSLYMALSGKSMEDVVRPNLKKEFYENYHEWFPAEACDEHRSEFVSARVAGTDWCTEDRPCCQSRKRFDKRTPGLFKVEFEGDGIVALCSKTYFCFGDKGDKLSCKGLRKCNNVLTKQKYLHVLKSQISGGGVNVGFKTDGKSVFTYEQQRASLSFLYFKRQVHCDGVTTFPILI